MPWSGSVRVVGDDEGGFGATGPMGEGKAPNVARRRPTTANTGIMDQLRRRPRTEGASATASLERWSVGGKRNKDARHLRAVVRHGPPAGRSPMPLFDSGGLNNRTPGGVFWQGTTVEISWLDGGTAPDIVIAADH